jgi:hypothetical protein
MRSAPVLPPRSVKALATRIAPAVLLLAACGSSSIVLQGPSDTLRSYATALQEGRVEDAYRLLSDEAKRTMSLEAFRRAVTENPHDAAEIAQALARPASDPVVTATVQVPNGDELLLIYEGGRWRIDASAVDLYGQQTPRQALMGFLRAFDRKRYDVILRYVPDAEKEGVASGEEEPAAEAPKEAAKPGDKPAAGKESPPKAVDKPAPTRSAPVQLTAEKLRAAWEGPQKEQINRIVQAIKTALPTAQIEETGDSAAMPYGAGGTVAFVREHGAWKIKDF